jgi:glycosylphosphatidylinositol transamidase
MLRTASVQAVGLPSAGHGLLVRHRVEALTVRALPNAPYSRRYGLQDMGNVVCGIVRSLNNLLEHLHHSFYFYILPRADHYVSVSLYTPPLALILVGSLLKAISLWVITGLKHKSSNASNEDQVTQFAFGEVQRNMQLILPAFLCSQLAGVAVYAAPNIGVLLMPSMSQADAALVGMTLTAVVCMVLVPIIVRRFVSTTDVHNTQWAILHCFTLFAHTMVLTGLSMMNFAFGFLFSVITVIPARMLSHLPNQHISRRLFHQLIIVLASPPVVLWIGCLMYLHLNGGFLSSSLGSQLFEITKLLHAAILVALRHEHLTGTWAYAAVTLVVWPNWLLFWTASWKPAVGTGDDVTREKKEQ